ncbi:ecdysteroid-phosphate phosphatase isoform X2 [Condylostylus longicornis]|uniref:ecdysteroid-phosphate phosphatase isoform X2 n=1 Tax=Condylostylus longicornis TaxID=2530218 RepID=UPI00244E397D|nr:ecdysteroid-phosphate phosphatase isoform X2 [Condylostylus longicornis]
MAALPPRKNATPTRLSKKSVSPLQTLLQMGFSKHRAEKALASTGNRSVQLASDWLLAHVGDQTLDECSPREYILYACPSGPLGKVLEEFWAKSKELCGWNGAHNFVPHITLVSFFKAPDECAPYLSKSLKTVVDMVGAVMENPIKLELYTSQNFMGFFVEESDANFLKRLALQYVKEVSNSTISLEPHVKSLHMTLAYQFQQKDFGLLRSLVEKLDPNIQAGWELRLYSRDSRLGTKQVHEVLYTHTPLENDELQLRLGDYIYLNTEAVENSSDGWVEGISWLTGMTGYLPSNYTQRTAESDVWTLHRTVPLYSITPPIPSISEEHDNADGPINQINSEKKINNESLKALAIPNEKSSSIQNSDDSEKNFGEKSLNKLIKNLDSSSLNDESFSMYEKTLKNLNLSSRKIYLMRHGERVDFTFGTWIPYCFDEFNNYIRKDLNMPKFLPKRKNCPEGWQNDSPLTNIGLFQAQLIGEAMSEADVTIDHVYCSPSYRCVQTCSSALEGMKLKEKLPIHIEPGFFEWMAWYPDGIPDFCSAEELNEANYNINSNYKCVIDESVLESCLKETSEDFYLRNYEVMEKIIQNTTGNLFVVAHAATLETCTRQLVGKNPRSTNELRQIIHKIPYCSLISVESSNREWKIVEPVSLPVTHSKNPRFEWNILVTS